MLIVSYNSHSATWDDDEMQWHSASPEFADALNISIPDRLHAYDAPFREGGRPQIALEAAQSLFGNDLIIVKQTEEEPPEEQDGTDY